MGKGPFWPMVRVLGGKRQRVICALSIRDRRGTKGAYDSLPLPPNGAQEGGERKQLPFSISAKMFVKTFLQNFQKNAVSVSTSITGSILSCSSAFEFGFFWFLSSESISIEVDFTVWKLFSLFCLFINRFHDKVKRFTPKLIFTVQNVLVWGIIKLHIEVFSFVQSWLYLIIIWNSWRLVLKIPISTCEGVQALRWGAVDLETPK